MSAPAPDKAPVDYDSEMRVKALIEMLAIATRRKWEQEARQK